MPPLLTIENLSKSFPGQVALDDVDLTIGVGQTHALVGQNGSGKSTLIKVLAGYHQPTGPSSATLHHKAGAHSLRLGDSKSAELAGIRFVHQDLGLVGGLSAVENLALGGNFLMRRGRIDWRAEAKRSQAELAELGFDDFSVKTPVGRLAPSQKTAVAVARALRGWEQGASLLVLDEPTASLPGADVARLFEAIHLLKARGVSILYVSHHLDEVFAIADEVTVLRDGKRITTANVADLNHDRLIELMIGHRLERHVASVLPERGRIRLDVSGMSGANVTDFDLSIAAGEVVGIAGVTGSGRESIVPLITGQIPTTAGDITVDGTPLPPYSPRAGLAAGLAFVAAERGTQGIFPLMSVVANMTICDVGRNKRGGRLRHSDERDEADHWINRLRVKTASGKAPIASLSGGNQQKVLFARMLRLNPKVVVLDEPTHGVDVGAKEEIHSLVDEAANFGAAVLVVSTDTEELIRLVHRVIIMQGGLVCAELSGAEITAENIERAQLKAKVDAT